MQSARVLSLVKHYAAILLTCFLVSLLSSCANSPTIQHETKIPDEVAKISEEYISGTKGWSKNDYNLRYVMEEYNNIFIAVDHKDDNKLTYTVGGGVSIVLMIDIGTLKIVKELRYQ